MKKLLMIALIVVVGLVGNVVASDEVSYSLNSEIWSSYITPDNGVISHNTAVSQTAFSADFGNGLYAGVWVSTGLSKNGPWDDEVDYFAGYVFDVGNASVDVGLTYYDFEELFDGGSGNFLFPTVKISTEEEFGRHTVSPYAKIATPIGLDGVSGGSGVIGYLGVESSRSSELFSDVTVSSKLGLIIDDGAYWMDRGVVLEYHTGISVELDNDASWDLVKFKLYTPLGGSDDSRETELAVGTGLTFNF